MGASLTYINRAVSEWLTGQRDFNARQVKVMAVRFGFSAVVAG